MKEGNVVQHHGLYRSEFEHDNCGIGAIVNIKGQKSHDTVANALKIVENLEHRAALLVLLMVQLLFYLIILLIL